MNQIEAADAEGQAGRLIAALIVAMTAWRLAVAWLLPVTQDEAYYFDWARSLAWGYFDHPPGVALIGVGTWLAPGSALAARSGGLIVGALTLMFLALLFRNSGIRTRRDLTLALVLAFATLPGLAAGIITTPDTVLALGWAVTLHEAERALAGDRRRWLGAGLATGIGLLGKYTMVLIGPVLLWAILRSDPRALRTPWPYLGGLLALLVFAPNILWNADNDWLTMRFQFGHGFSTDVGALPTGPESEAGTVDNTGPQSLAERLQSLLAYLGTQLGFWGLIAIPMLFAPWLARDRDPRGPRLAAHAGPLLWAATLFPLGFFALVATVTDVEANWPAMYLLSGAALVAILLCRARAWAYAAVAGNLLLVSLYAVHGATGALPLPDSQNRILRETHGFRGLAELATGLDAPVYADRYQDTAMLRFYSRELGASQWPGLTRPSEYLRGRIAPRIDPGSTSGPFWLVTRRGAAPAIPGFSPDRQRTLHDCAGLALSETPAPPCARPLHTWFLYRYEPVPGAG